MPSVASSLHLAAGSEKPAETKGLARLYSMKLCPYAHRIRLILSLKKIPHEIVNIHLKNKPEWYFQVHPEGKVPAFVDADGKVVTDSLDIANYLDEKYPEPPLYNEATKARDLELLDQYSKITGIFTKAIHGNDTRPINEIVAEILDLLMEFEEELKKRGTDFFGGSQPGMLDVLMWPWVEPGKALPLIYKQPVNFNKEKFPSIVKWVSKMRSLPFVQENANPCEKFAQLIEDSRAGKVDYDKF